jgi:hypothetical protein
MNTEYSSERTPVATKNLASEEKLMAMVYFASLVEFEQVNSFSP